MLAYYYVSYAYKDLDGWGFRGYDLVIDRVIENSKIIQEIADQIVNEHSQFSEVAILNWVLFSIAIDPAG